MTLYRRQANLNSEIRSRGYRSLDLEFDAIEESFAWIKQQIEGYVVDAVPAFGAAIDFRGYLIDEGESNEIVLTAERYAAAPDEGFNAVVKVAAVNAGRTFVTLGAYRSELYKINSFGNPVALAKCDLHANQLITICYCDSRFVLVDAPETAAPEATTAPTVTLFNIGTHADISYASTTTKARIVLISPGARPITASVPPNDLEFPGPGGSVIEFEINNIKDRILTYSLQIDARDGRSSYEDGINMVSLSGGVGNQDQSKTRAGYIEKITDGIPYILHNGSLGVGINVDENWPTVTPVSKLLPRALWPGQNPYCNPPMEVVTLDFPDFQTFIGGDIAAYAIYIADQTSPGGFGYGAGAHGEELTNRYPYYPCETGTCDQGFCIVEEYQ